MLSATLARAAVRARSPAAARCLGTMPATPRPLACHRGGCVQKVARARGVVAFSTTSAARSHHPYDNETFEEFTTRYENEFNTCTDTFELQRNLNNAFAYDLVPSPSVISAALKACRRLNDFPTAVRIFEGLKHKVENSGQYEEYLRELEPLREELGIPLKEYMFPEAK